MSWTSNLPETASGNKEPKFNYAVRMDFETHRKLKVVSARTTHSMMAIIRALVGQAFTDTKGAARGMSERGDVDAE